MHIFLFFLFLLTTTASLHSSQQHNLYVFNKNISKVQAQLTLFTWNDNTYQVASVRTIDLPPFKRTTITLPHYTTFDNQQPSPYTITLHLENCPDTINLNMHSKGLLKPEDTIVVENILEEVKNAWKRKIAISTNQTKEWQCPITKSLRLTPYSFPLIIGEASSPNSDLTVDASQSHLTFYNSNIQNMLISYAAYNLETATKIITHAEGCVPQKQFYQLTILSNTPNFKNILCLVLGEKTCIINVDNCTVESGDVITVSHNHAKHKILIKNQWQKVLGKIYLPRTINFG